MEIKTKNPGDYRLIRLANGAYSVFSADYGEKMHPGLGPRAEADLLYVRQLKIPERMRANDGEFVVWDVGLGAAANAVAVLSATKEIARPLQLVSFDNTAGPLEFALRHAEALDYLKGFESQLEVLLRSRHVTFQNNNSPVTWEFHLGDFPTLLAGSTQHLPHPDAILFDAFSPARNPAMWTLPLFVNLFRALDPKRPCNLTTYSRSTMFRVALLLAGFFVGRGVATGLKEETTVAANSIELIDTLLDAGWLMQARRSGSAEPMMEPVYSQSALTQSTWERLCSHPQFCH